MIEQHFVELIAGEINAKPEQVAAAIGYFDKGANIPFVARYRKDVTGGLSESKLERIEERNDYFTALCSRKDAFLDNLEKQGRLTDELRTAFAACTDHVALEDLILPFKKQRNNRAAIAANKGLLPLADYIWAQSAVSPPPVLYAESFVVVDKQVLSVEEALEGARHILAECIAMNADIRREVRKCLSTEGKLTVHHARVDAEKSSRYASFKKYEKALGEVTNDAFLTILKGEREGVLRVDLVVDDDRLIDSLASRFVQDEQSEYAVEIRAAVLDAYKRLLRPVIEEEVFAKVRKEAEENVISGCRDYVRNLLLSAPVGAAPVMGISCWAVNTRSFAVIGPDGAVLATQKVDGDPDSDLDEKTEAMALSMLEGTPVEGIGVSSGPGGREVLRIVQGLLRKNSMKPFVTLVQDVGLAAYVHSSPCSAELPEMEEAARASVSIARRLQDPLRELVKVEPCALAPSRLANGVNRRRLQAGIVRTIESVVNRVGVEVNLASVDLLRYVCGLQLGVAQAVVEKRSQLEGFKNRTNLLDVSGIGEKTYQQCVGFMRIVDGENPLDGSAIHPEAYPAVDKILATLNCTLEQVRESMDLLNDLDLQILADEKTGPLTLEDICYELGRIGRDPRRRFRPPQILIPLAELDDLEVGMVLEGIVTNITDFGIFVSLGLAQEGLVHRSEVGRNILNDPKRALQVGDVVKVSVLQVDKASQRIALSIREAAKLSLTRPHGPRRLRHADGATEGAPQSDGDRRRGPRGDSRRDGGRDGYGGRSAGHGDQHSPRRRRGKDDMTVPKINRGNAKKGESSLLNTSLADQLAALRDKIVTGKK